MKKITTLFFAILCCITMLKAEEIALTIHVETPGTLSDKIFDAGQRPAVVKKLIVTGTLNDADFTCMRETMTSLVDVDLLGINNTFGVIFRGNKNIQKIILPEKITLIESLAFYSCSSLKSIIIPNNVIKIGYRAFSDCISLETIIIPNSVTRIEGGIFYNCRKLKSIELPDNMLSLSTYSTGTGASYGFFENCSSITSIKIPSCVTVIGHYTFKGCSNLESIIIPQNVNSIEFSAFKSCSSLNSITCLGSTPPKASDLDAPTSTCTLIVPKVAYNDYSRHAYWGQFLNIETIDVDYKKLTAIANNAEWGVVEGGGYYDNGDEAILTATANNGYRFVKWSDEVTDNPRVVVVTQDSTFTAIFEANTFAISTSVIDDAMGSVTEGGKYAYGTEITLTATANSGYRFTQWSDGNTENPRTIIVTENKTYTAEFVLEEFALYAISASPELGYVKHTIEAIAIEGFEFDRWSDDNTDNPRTIILTEDTKLYAYFRMATGGNPVDLETAKISSANVYANGGVLHVEGATSGYHVLDAAGRLVYSGSQTVLTLPRGIYLVTINGEVEKVVL